jgi:DNA mismatch repair protein MutL
MNRIQLLTEQVANQIAAGEVVERPASVVKELVENAIDAKARQITVEIRRGGRQLIRVSDDGAGMSRDDALLCLERHATSKIRSMDDLTVIRSLGFRGEALPSIASVSRFTLITCERAATNPEATEVQVQGGKLIDVRTVGHPPGTTVEVRQLFYNLPARRKFLRTEETERTHIQQVLTLAGLAHPEIGFMLRQEDRLLWQLPPMPASRPTVEGVRDRLRILLGAETAMVPVDCLRDLPVHHAASSGDDPTPVEPPPTLRVWGFVGAPGVSRSTRQDQHLFVNRRPVENRGLNYALLEGYHTALMKGRYPIACLFLEIDPAEVDANVHPAKREVRFRHEQAVRAAVSAAVRQALLDHHRADSDSDSALSAAGSTRSPVSSPAATSAPREGGGQLQTPAATAPNRQDPDAQDPQTPVEHHHGLGTAAPQKGPRSSGASDSTPATDWLPAFLPAPGPAASPALVRAQVDALAPSKEDPRESDAQPGVDRASAVGDPSPALPAARALLQVPLRLVGVVGRLYVVLESDRGLVLMDQHAAHERVLFEQMLRRLEQGGGEAPSQRLLLPETVEVSLRDAQFLRENLEALTRLGLGIAEFGERTFLLDALPPFVRVPDARQFVRDVIDALVAAGRQVNQLRLGEAMVAKTVCRHAVKANDPLARPELERLVEDLRACAMPYTCPHGRPTLIELNYRELERKFGRVV